MTTGLPDKDEVLNAIREAAKTLGRAPSRAEFKSLSGMSEYQVLKHFPSWREAVRAAGLEPHSTNMPLDPGVLLEDWGQFVRRVRRIPTRDQYRREGRLIARGFLRRNSALGRASLGTFVPLLSQNQNGLMLSRSSP